MKSVGIDIGTSQIKVVEIQTTSKGIALSSYQIKEFTQRANSDQDLETIEFLREIASKYDPNQTRFCVGLRQDRVVIRNKTFPFIERLKIAKTLPLELDEDIPFTIENSVYDAKIIRTVGTQAEVLACATPKAHLTKLLDLLRDGGIEAEVISTEGIAFANLFENWNAPVLALPEPTIGLDESVKPDREIHLVLNIGMSRTLVCAFEENRLIGVRSILWGGRNITEAISKKYELPFAEAQKEMELKAFILNTKQESHFEAKIFSDTISKSVREMLRDLQLSILEFRGEFNATVSKIDITGGVSHIQGLGPFMTQALEIPVNRISLLDHFSQVFFEKTDVTDSRLGVAVGLAIEGLKKPRNPALNFLKGDFAKKNTQLQATLNQWSLLLKVAAACVAILYIWSFTRENLALQLADNAVEVLKTQGKNIAKLPSKQLNDEGIKKYIREKKKIAAELKTLSQVAQMNSAMEILKKLNDRIPGKSSLKIDVKRFRVDESQVLIEGYAGSPREVGFIQQSLNNLAIDGKVSVLNPTLIVPSGKSSFAFRFNVDRGVTQK